MAVPLNDVNKIEIPASKPGNIKDEYVKIQNVNNALRECKVELSSVFSEPIMTVINTRLDKWLRIRG